MYIQGTERVMHSGDPGGERYPYKLFTYGLNEHGLSQRPGLLAITHCPSGPNEIGTNS